MKLFATEFDPRLAIIPRDYQGEAADNSIGIWDSGVIGALVRAFTGGGKTIISCLLIDRWLSRGDDYRAMVLSYEQQLVDQFAQEIEDVLGIFPGIEMERRKWAGEKIAVVSRQSVLPKTLATDEQKAWLLANGVDNVGLLTKTLAKSLITQMKRGQADVGDVRAVCEAHNGHWMTNQERGVVSRLHRFDPQYNWLIIADEAHKFAYHLTSVGHIYDWFSPNPKSRWLGVTATPKRSDGVSIGYKMFPGVALDYPLYSPTGRCAVRDGYAVPYRQKYICVEGVDFKSLSKVRGDFDEAELERILGTEEQLARLAEPMLDMCGERRTLIFNPTVQMAKDVAAYVNARAKCKCNCGKVKWYSSLMVGDGAQCECGTLLDVEHIVLSGDQCQVIHESIPTTQRKEIYEGHQTGKFQFLSVCGLCKEGYNDPDIACVAVFRPVSKAASSLAEQMKGRAARPLRGLIEGMATAQERLDAIAGSTKPDALIIDLVGITGLADCASTALIYSEGLPDDVREKAADLLVEGEIEDVEEAVEEAKRLVDEDRERIREERLQQERRAKAEAQRRAQAEAEVTYSTHDVGTGSAYDPTRPTDKMLGYIRSLGMEFENWEPTKRQAGRMIEQLLAGMTAQEVAYLNGVQEGSWKPAFASVKQVMYLRSLGYRGKTEGMTPSVASNAIGGMKEPMKHYPKAINEAPNEAMLTEVARRIYVQYRDGKLTELQFTALVARGKRRREEMRPQVQPPAEDF
jgi:superfamily II DNA or RNA helicase